MEQPIESSELSYDPLNIYFNDQRNKILTSQGYVIRVLPTNASFIMFCSLETPKGESDEGKIFKEYGLKFHISLPEYDRDMYKRGWDIVKDTLMRHQVTSFKVIRANLRMSDTPGQEGKDVTIYVDDDPSKTIAQWKEALEDISKNLLKGGIKPGYRAHGTSDKPEKPVIGSNYITYRYYNEKTKKSTWPNPDPCNNIKVNVAGQADIPILEKQKTEEIPKTKDQTLK